MIHQSDYSEAGGGGIAMHRLHSGLRRIGFDSKILCHRKTIDSPEIRKIPRGKIFQIIEPNLKKFTSRLGLNDIHVLNSFGIKDSKEFLDADVINIHGIHGGFFNYLALPSLANNKPTIFTLHDMWAFTGHCAFSYECDRWKIGCGNCPYPENHPSVKRDNTRLEWKLKDWVYSRSDLTIITLSNTQTEQAKQSILNRFPIHHIPNGVDVERYQPLDPEQCRSILGIPPRQKVLMVAALSLNQFNKGGDLLLKALRGLPESLKAETVLMLLGGKGESISEAVGMETLDLGYISNDRVKAICYSAADLFVHPTRAETLPLVLQESMACGTPMVAFGVGGVVDLVRPGLTGYLAEPGTPKDLREGIIQLLEDEALRSMMSQHCRKIVLNEYTLELQVQRYVELYRRLLCDKHHDSMKPKFDVLGRSV